MADTEIQRSVAKGCLAGLGLAAGFLVGGLVLYFVARLAGLGLRMALVVGIAGGPVVVSALVLGGFLMRARVPRPERSDSQADDAATTWDDT